MKKLIKLGLMLALVLITAACSQGANSGNNSGNTEGSEDKNTTIEFWTMQLKPTFTDYIQGVIDDFEEENPNITVEWLDVPAADLDKKILSAVSSNTAPDVVNLNPTFASQLASMDALVNMDEELSDEEKKGYVEGAWKANQLNGETFAMPWYLSTEVTLNNSMIYEEAGLDTENAPETYEEAREMTETIMNETDKYGYFPSMDLSLVLQHMVKMGVDLTNEDMSKAAFNTEDGLKAFEYFTEMYQNDMMPAEALTGDQRESIDMYQAGQTTFFAGSQFISQIEENAPEIYENTVPSQAITGKSGKKSISVQNVVVPSQTKNKDAAVKFGKFLTNAENQLAFTKLTPILPSAKEALEDPYFTEKPEDATPKDMVRIVSASQLDEAELLVPPMDNYNELRQSMFDAISASMLGEMEPQKALDKAEKEWNEILSQ